MVRIANFIANERKPVYCTYCGDKLVDDKLIVEYQGFDRFTGVKLPNLSLETVKCPKRNTDNMLQHDRFYNYDGSWRR